MGSQLLLQLFVVLLSVQIIFSLWPDFISVVVRNYHVNPLLIAVYRDVIASICLWTAVSISEGGVLSRVSDIIASSSDRDKTVFFGLGVVSTINSVGYVLALQYVSPFNSALLHPSIPVFAALFGFIFGVEKFTMRKAMGSSLCIAGSVAVVVTQSSLTLSGSLFGNSLLGEY